MVATRSDCDTNSPGATWGQCHICVYIQDNG